MITRILVLGTRRQKRRVREGRGRTEAGSEGDASLPALKTAEGATGQEMQAASASWKRQGNGFSPRDSRKGHSSATT